MVDRYSAYKAMAQVKLGNVVLVFCWATSAEILSRSARAGPSTRSGLWPGLAGFALYRHDRGRRSTKTGMASSPRPI